MLLAPLRAPYSEVAAPRQADAAGCSMVRLREARLALHTRNGLSILERSKAAMPCGTVVHDRKLLTANDGRGNLHVARDGWDAGPVFAGRFVADLDIDSVPRVIGQ